MRFVPVLPVLLALMTSCLPEPGSPTHANEHWQLLETEHFDLETDLPAEQGRIAAEALEQARGALLAAAWNRGVDSRVTQRTSVVVLKDETDWDHYSRHQFVGLYTQQARPTIFLFGTPERWDQRTVTTDESTTSVLRHELVHRLAAGIYGRQPRWFAEGLAQFLETMFVSSDGLRATLGRVNLVALQRYNGTHGCSVAELLDWKSDVDVEDRGTSARYGTSWLLVHYLYNTQSAAFGDFQSRLAQGADPKKAWGESFKGVSLQELDKQLNQYSKFGKFTEFDRVLVKSTSAIEQKPFTAADVLATRAQLALVSSQMRQGAGLAAEARRETDQSLELESGNPLALRVAWFENGGPRKDSVERLRKQVKARPDQGDAWLLLGEALDDQARPEREAALRKAVTLMPRVADAYNALAWELVTSNRADAALPLATKASLLAPWSAETLDTYAAALFGVGRCPEALTVQQRAIDHLPEAAPRQAAIPYLKKLEDYAKACATAPAAPAPAPADSPAP